MGEKTVRSFVTGGAGFIGSHLVERLLDEGHSVTVYDKLLLGPGRLSHLLRREDFRLVEADLLDQLSLQEAMARHDQIWHLGANTDIPGGNSDVELDLKNCTIATHNVLEAMRATGVPDIIFTSSSTVYGEATAQAISEEAGPLFPISLYGAAKLACEAFISAYCHLFNFRSWIFRFGNVVGGRMSHGVILDFIGKLKANPHELVILGDGHQEKNFFLVEECIEGMLHAVHRRQEQCSLFNLGCESTVTVAEIASIVIEEMGLRNVGIRYTGGRRGWPGDVPIVRYDLSKIKALGWEAQHTSAEAVRIATRRLLGKGGDLRQKAPLSPSPLPSPLEGEGRSNHETRR